MLLCLPLLAGAASWRGIEPGVSKRNDVVAKFGPPWKEIKNARDGLMVYSRPRAIEHSRQVQFRFDPTTSVVTRIDFFPSAILDVRSVEELYGPACGPNTAPPCYERRKARGKSYLYFADLHVGIFLDPVGENVTAITYLAPTTAAPGESGNETASNNTGTKPDEHGTTSTSSGNAEGSDPFAAAMTGLEDKKGPGGESAPTADAKGGNQPVVVEEPLTFGGQFYYRTLVSGIYKDQPDAACCAPRPFRPDVTTPMLVDLFVGAQPNDHVRGLVRPRLIFNPSPSASAGFLVGGSALAAQTVTATIDELWLRFDLASSVYVTVGRQHLKWGVSHIWSPTDFLAPSPRNPVATFDERVGSDLIKVHIPVESLGWNFYGLALVDSDGPPEHPLRAGMAYRAEFVLGLAELGLGAVFQEKTLPRYAADLSMGLGPLDLYGEVAMRRAPELTPWELAPADQRDPNLGYVGNFLQPRPPAGWYPSASAGVIYTHAFSEFRRYTLNLEGFYQSYGYQDTPTFLPLLVMVNDYRPFYFGQYYLGATASYSTGSRPTTYGATVIGNLSDRSFLARLTTQLSVTNNLSLEFFGEVPFGKQGEFNLDIERPEEVLPDGTVHEAFRVPRSVFRLGAGLRIML